MYKLYSEMLSSKLIRITTKIKWISHQLKWLLPIMNVIRVKCQLETGIRIQEDKI